MNSQYAALESDDIRFPAVRLLDASQQMSGSKPNSDIDTRSASYSTLNRGTNLITFYLQKITVVSLRFNSLPVYYSTFYWFIFVHFTGL